MEERWKRETRKWTEAWDTVHPDQPWDAETLVSRMEERLPAEVLWKVNQAFEEGLIETDPAPGRGHFIRIRDGQSLSTMGSAKQATPFWELFVQLAEYRSLHIAVGGRDDLRVQLEDGRMDLTLREKGTLIGYVEAKEQASKAESLGKEMRALSGVALDEPTGVSASKPDAYRKAWYLLDEFRRQRRVPGQVQFSIRSGGKRGQALHEDRYRAHVDPDARTMTLEAEPEGSLVEWADVTFAATDTRRACATLAWRVARGSTDPMFVDLGSVKTHRVYRVVDGKPRLALEFQRSGAVLGHRQTGGLSEAQISRLRDVLAANNLDLADRHSSGADKQFFVWQDRATGVGWVPTPDRALALAPALAEALATSA